MKIFHFTFFMLILLISACTSTNESGEMAPDADTDSLPDLTGTYVINGVDPIGDEYGGHLTIVPGRDNHTYHLQWIIVGGIQEGVGLVKGNQLFVDWQTVDGIENASGTAVFTITQKGQLYGIRTSDHLIGEGREQAYPNQ
jgi:hypothetical protein